MNIGILSHPGMRPFEIALANDLRQRRKMDNLEVAIDSAGFEERSSLDVLLAVGIVTDKDIDQLPRLSLIQAIGAGYESIDVEAATAAGIWVSYSPSDQTGNADSVAEFVIMQMLNLSRDLLTLVDSVEHGGRSHSLPYGLKRKRVTLVGLGCIGQAVLSRLGPFECSVEIVTRTPEKPRTVENYPLYPLSQLAVAVRESDFVICCLRADQQNAGLFDEKIFQNMKRGSVFLNIARGSLVDENALYQALVNGHIRAAALDVLQTEPPSAKDRLVHLRQTIVTLHAAYLTDEMLAGTAAFLDETLSRFWSGAAIATVINSPTLPRRKLT